MKRPVSREDFIEAKESLMQMQALLFNKQISYNASLPSEIGFNSPLSYTKLKPKLETSNAAWNYILESSHILRETGLTSYGTFATLKFSESLQPKVAEFLQHVPNIIDVLNVNLAKTLP